MEPQKNTLMGVLSYLGPLVIIPILTAKNDPFVKYHIKQGLVLLVIGAVVWVFAMTLWQFYVLYQIINVGMLVLMVLGIINVVQGKTAPLPLVGQFARYFTF